MGGGGIPLDPRSLAGGAVSTNLDFWAHFMPGRPDYDLGKRYDYIYATPKGKHKKRYAQSLSPCGLKAWQWTTYNDWQCLDFTFL